MRHCQRPCRQSQHRNITAITPSVMTEQSFSGCWKLSWIQPANGIIFPPLWCILLIIHDFTDLLSFPGQGFRGQTLTSFSVLTILQEGCQEQAHHSRSTTFQEGRNWSITKQNNSTLLLGFQGRKCRFHSKCYFFPTAACFPLVSSNSISAKTAKYVTMEYSLTGFGWIHLFWTILLLWDPGYSVLETACSSLGRSDGKPQKLCVKGSTRVFHKCPKVPQTVW